MQQHARDQARLRRFVLAAGPVSLAAFVRLLINQMRARAQRTKTPLDDLVAMVLGALLDRVIGEGEKGERDPPSDQA